MYHLNALIKIFFSFHRTNWTIRQSYVLTKCYRKNVRTVGQSCKSVACRSLRTWWIYIDTLQICVQSVYGTLGHHQHLIKWKQVTKDLCNVKQLFPLQYYPGKISYKMSFIVLLSPDRFFFFSHFCLL